MCEHTRKVREEDEFDRIAHEAVKDGAGVLSVIASIESIAAEIGLIAQPEAEAAVDLISVSHDKADHLDIATLRTFSSATPVIQPQGRQRIRTTTPAAKALECFFLKVLPPCRRYTNYTHDEEYLKPHISVPFEHDIFSRRTHLLPDSVDFDLR